MANKKISALTGATTPLAGTETLPVVQSSSTVNVSVANLTAGRAVSALSYASTATTGTSPFTVSSTTNVANLNASSLNGATFANPGPIGTTPSTGAFTSLSASQPITTTYTGTYAISSTSAATGPTAINFYNTGGNLILGTEGSAGGNLLTGDTPYAVIIASYSNKPIQFGINDILRATIDTSGNYVPKVAATGINFTANTPASGMTSQLLNWYEEGTWTPIDSSGAGLTLTVLANSAKYVRTGRMVTATFALSYPVTAAAGQATIGGLPFTAGSGAGQGGYLVYTSLASIPGLNVGPSTTKFYLYGGGGTGLSNVNMSAQDIRGVVTYFV